MSDHDKPQTAAPGGASDPVDEAYRQAETLLSDDATRAARRARVLEAVQRETEAPAAAPRPPRSAWSRGGPWLVAASVAALGLFIAAEVYQPITPPPAVPTRPPATSPPPAAQPLGGQRSGPVAAPRTPVVGAHGPASPAQPASPIAPSVAKAEPPPSAKAEGAAPARRDFPASTEIAPASAPADTATEDAVTAERRSPPPSPPPPPAREAVPAEQATTAPPAPEVQGAPVSELVTAGRPSPAARLRAAAAAGRTAEVRALLARGAPVDAADEGGDSALMLAVKSDQPAAAAVLVRHGASLDRRNGAGQSVRDLAALKDDPALNRALGLER